jgi:hypothetical protein
MNGRPMPTRKVAAVRAAPTTAEADLMAEYPEVDLASDMHDFVPPPIVDEESGVEPEVRPTLTLFTEDTDSMSDEDSNNGLLNNSGRAN